MARRHCKRQRKHKFTSLASSSSSSSSSSSTSSSTSSSRGEKPRVSKSSQNAQDNLRSERVLTISSSLLRSKVLVQTPDIDSNDGIIIYSTQNKHVHAHHCAAQQLLNKWPKVRHYCCNQSTCRLCCEVCRSSRAKLMPDVVKTHPATQRGNRAKCNSIVERILSRASILLCCVTSEKAM